MRELHKTAIKNFAIWARVHLIEAVTQKALAYEITAEPTSDSIEEIGGRTLTRTEQKQRKRLIEEIRIKGFAQVMEEVAYTWFNRFIALRYMEVNGFLPSGVRVFTDQSGAFCPTLLQEAMTVELDGLDRGKVAHFLEKKDEEGLYRYLLITQCNALSKGLPGMFERLEGYTELLLPGNLLQAESVLGRMVADIPEEDWDDAVQIIGWLYQYYNLKLKDDTFALLKQNVKISKERIPAATQLFTPDWIVRYMAENSLGRLWCEGHPEFDRSRWSYYLDEAEQTPETEEKLSKLREKYRGIKPEEIRVIDPCMGSGHILVYAFDMLMEIYIAVGWSEAAAARSILEHNLYGLDIDDRVGQLAYFAVMMKARKYNSSILDEGITLQLCAIQDSSHLKDGLIDYVAGQSMLLRSALLELRAAFAHAKELGSVILLPALDYTVLYARIEEIRTALPEDLYTIIYQKTVVEHLLPLVRQAELLSGVYDVVITNPPYMGNSGMSPILSRFVKKNYLAGKSDLFAVFIERCEMMLKENAFQAMITQHAWMFLSSFEQLREKMPAQDMVNLIHLGAHAFEEIGGEVVQTVAFVRRGSYTPGYRGCYCRLVEPQTPQGKEALFLSGAERYQIAQDRFAKLPGAPIAYWASEAVLASFEKGSSITDYGRFTGSQNITADNARFLRFFWEVDEHTVNDRWRFYAKGGEYRQYYGNLELVVDWSEEARRFYQTTPTANLLAREFWYKEGITYTAVSGKGTGIGFRYLPEGCLFDKGGPSIQPDSHLYELLALLNSKVARHYFQLFNPSINLQVKDIKNLPIILPECAEVEQLAKENIRLAKEDWAAFETAWEFQRHLLIGTIGGARLLADCYKAWETEAAARFDAFKENQERLNEIFITLYGLREELSPTLTEREVTIRRAERSREIRSLISYAVGCLLGRYSVDAAGIAYAGGDWDDGKYLTVMPAEDGILPICEEEAAGDLADRFVGFIRTVYGEETLEENLRFIAEALGGKGSARAVIRSYFSSGFYADHLKQYQNRPIYWMFDAGKQGSFRALVYLHRYQPELLTRLGEHLQERWRQCFVRISALEEALDGTAASERAALGRQLEKLRGQLVELADYEERLHALDAPMLDRNDGVQANYRRLGDLLAPLK